MDLKLKVDKKAVEQIAKLARLQMSDAEASEYSEQLSKVLNYFEQISQVDTKGVEPLVTPSEIQSYWRADQAHQEISAEEMVANAPQKTGHLFTTPPVV